MIDNFNSPQHIAQATPTQSALGNRAAPPSQQKLWLRGFVRTLFMSLLVITGALGLFTLYQGGAVTFYHGNSGIRLEAPAKALKE